VAENRVASSRKVKKSHCSVFLSVESYVSKTAKSVFFAAAAGTVRKVLINMFIAESNVRRFQKI